MIRLIIIALGLLLVWTLFFSKFDRQRKIIIAMVVVVLVIFGLWYEQRGETPKSGLVQPAQIQACGVAAKHSYRTNYDIAFCLQNLSGFVIKRVALSFSVMECHGEGESEECNELQAVNKEFPVTIVARGKVNLTENLNFSRMLGKSDSENMQNLRWAVKPISVKAVQ